MRKIIKIIKIMCKIKKIKKKIFHNKKNIYPFHLIKNKIYLK